MMAKASSQRRKTSGRAGQSPAWLVYGGIGAIALLMAAVLIRIGQSAQPAPLATLEFDRSVETGVTLEGNPYRGAAGAPVVIDIYEDFGCPHCRDFFEDAEPLLEEAYLRTGKVRLVSHYLAIVNANSLPGAEAAACAAEQAHFWEMRQLLFANQGRSFSRDLLLEFGEVIGLDRATFARCFDGQKHRLAVQERNVRARQLEITGTPTIFVGGARYEGALPFFSDRENIPGLQALIEDLLESD